MTTTKERILYIADNVENTKADFFKKIGASYGNFTGKSKNSEPSNSIIKEILLNYKEINPTWLVTGNGEPFNSIENSQVIHDSGQPYQTESIPLLPFDAFAGAGSELIDGVDFNTITERYNIPLFDGLKIDFMMNVKGSSMYPKYNSGDVVACRIIDELTFIQWNKVHVVDTLSQGVVLKRLKKSENAKNVVCKSDNKDYDIFEIPKKDIRNIALVVGVIRLE